MYTANDPVQMAADRAAGFDALSPDEVCDYLKEQIPSISKRILENVKEHKSDGEVFLALNDEYLREVALLLGDRLKIKHTVAAALAITSTVSFRLYFASSVHFPMSFVHVHPQPTSDSSSLPSPTTFKSCTPLYLTSTPSGTKSFSPRKLMSKSVKAQILDR